MKIAVLGTGGVGGYLGGRLAASGCDVTFVARCASGAYKQRVLNKSDRTVLVDTFCSECRPPPPSAAC